MRPVVVTDAAVAYGRPHLKGVGTEAIAERYWADGGDERGVMADYGLTKHDLAVALWHEGTHGQARRRYAGWRQWADEIAGPRLGGWQPFDVDSLPLPPGRVSPVAGDAGRSRR
ncbi:MAG TPA: hypothetical protein VI172_17230 [Candidatus Dormibacteraeota bacterium]|jgi:uncharacterized protein (DUF433 family)